MSARNVKITWKVTTSYEKIFTEEQWIEECKRLKLDSRIDPMDALDSYEDPKDDDLSYYDLLDMWQDYTSETWAEIVDFPGPKAKRTSEEPDPRKFR